LQLFSLAGTVVQTLQHNDAFAVPTAGQVTDPMQCQCAQLLVAAASSQHTTLKYAACETVEIACKFVSNGQVTACQPPEERLAVI
jgi:hypothetical protein